MLVLASMHAQKRLGTCGTCVQIISHSIISHARVCVCVCVCARARARRRVWAHAHAGAYAGVRTRGWGVVGLF